MSQDKLSAYQTLYTCLETVARLMAPIAPFYADRLYTDLIAATGRDTVVSVHLAKFPECNEALIDGELEARMQMAQDVTSMVLALRRKVNIKVRQPLQCIMVPVVDEEQKMHIEAVKDLIMSEVNVKEIKFVDGAAGVLVKKVKCDFKKLGPKFGKQMKAVAAAVAGMSQEAIAELEKNGKYTFVLDGAEAVIETTDVEIFSEDIPGWLVANEGKLTVALEVTVTEELRREGVARELVNRIQNIRKSSGFEITDKIKVALSKNPQTDDAVNEYNTYICNQVLANSLELVDEVKNGTELNFDDFSLYVSVVKEIINLLKLSYMAEKTRYSDAELEEFRAIIMEKLELAERDYERLKSSIMNKDGNDTDDTSPTYKVLEEGANTLSKEETTRLAARQLKFIQDCKLL